MDEIVRNHGQYTCWQHHQVNCPVWVCRMRRNEEIERRTQEVIRAQLRAQRSTY